jgi:hypothetical protein
MKISHKKFIYQYDIKIKKKKYLCKMPYVSNIAARSVVQLRISLMWQLRFYADELFSTYWKQHCFGVSAFS